MSVLIKDMDMPIQCISCRMWTAMLIGGKVRDICRVGDFPVEPYKTGRDKQCPLIEIPASHGRLIDADDLAKVLQYYIDEAGWSEDINMALKWVKDEFIPHERTVIGAEK